MGDSDRTWMADALCADPSILTDMTSDLPAELDAARSVCRQCDVRLTCAQYAMDERELWGVWGGTLDWERRRALGCDSQDNPRVNTDDIWCPFCGNPEVSITKKRESLGYPVECGRCGVGWHTYRFPLKVRRALKRRRDRELDDVGRGVG